MIAHWSRLYELFLVAADASARMERRLLRAVHAVWRRACVCRCMSAKFASRVRSKRFRLLFEAWATFIRKERFRRLLQSRTEHARQREAFEIWTTFLAYRVQLSLNFAAACGLRTCRLVLRRWGRRASCRHRPTQCVANVGRLSQVSVLRGWLQLRVVIGVWERPAVFEKMRWCFRNWRREAALSEARWVLLLQVLLRWKSAADGQRSLKFKMRKFHMSCTQASAMLAVHAASLVAAALREWRRVVATQLYHLRRRAQAVDRARSRPLRLALEGFFVHRRQCQRLRHACSKLERAAGVQRLGTALNGAFLQWYSSAARQWDLQKRRRQVLLRKACSSWQAARQCGAPLMNALAKLRCTRLSQVLLTMRTNAAELQFVEALVRLPMRRCATAAQLRMCFQVWAAYPQRRRLALSAALRFGDCRATLRRWHDGLERRREDRRRTFLAASLARRRFLRHAYGCWLRAGISETWAARRGLGRQLTVAAGAQLSVVPAFAPCSSPLGSHGGADRLVLWAAALRVATVQGGG